MDWNILLSFGAYALISLISLALWWVIYDYVITPEVRIFDHIFSGEPNPAVALDLLGGILALGILNYSVLSTPSLSDYWADMEATALTLLGTVLLMGLLRLFIGGFLRVWFQSTRDAQGDIITMNNELFRQKNLATGLFSFAVYLILVVGLVEEDLLNLENYRLEATWNMLGIWLLGFGVILLHSFLYLGLGKKNNILHESFHDNNPAAPLSLLGLLAGMLMIAHSLLVDLESGQHIFNQWEIWAFLGVALVSVLGLRFLLGGLMYLVWGVKLRHELVERDNPAWGLLDGGIILALLLILAALLT